MTSKLSASFTVIVLRFSAMGDVALLASVMEELAFQNPSIKIVMVSRSFFKAFFNHIPQVVFHPIETKGIHRGFFGLRKLSVELGAYNANAMADVHENLRSRIISFLCKKQSLRVVRIDKGREEKKAMTRPRNKILIPLKTTAQRYADVFTQLGLKIKLSNTLVKKNREMGANILAILGDKKNISIGISPFAQHVYKMYPLAKMEEVISILSSKDYQIFIFGGGNSEKTIAETWANNYSNVHSVIGKINLDEELDLISNLHMMVSMDSAGMHLASLVGTTVVSIWGPTHPYLGFLGYGQKLENCVQVDHPNRPNSVYGNKPCLADGTSCIDLITAEMVVEKVEENLKQLH